MGKIILIIVLIIIASSGVVGITYYYRKFRDLLLETKDLLAAIFVALKDGKLTAEEKENIINEAMDMSPIAKDIGRQFLADAKGIGGKITDKVKDLTGK
jgi:site-specific recombinase XerD